MFYCILLDNNFNGFNLGVLITVSKPLSKLGLSVFDWSKFVLWPKSTDAGPQIRTVTIVFCDVNGLF